MIKRLHLPVPHLAIPQLQFMDKKRKQLICLFISMMTELIQVHFGQIRHWKQLGQLFRLKVALVFAHDVMDWCVFALLFRLLVHFDNFRNWKLELFIYIFFHWLNWFVFVFSWKSAYIEHFYFNKLFTILSLNFNSKSTKIQKTNLFFFSHLKWGNYQIANVLLNRYTPVSTCCFFLNLSTLAFNLLLLPEPLQPGFNLFRNLIHLDCLPLKFSKIIVLERLKVDCFHIFSFVKLFKTAVLQFYAQVVVKLVGFVFEVLIVSLWSKNRFCPFHF